MPDLNINIRANVRQAQAQIRALQAQIQQANAQMGQAGASGAGSTGAAAGAQKTAASVAAIEQKANQQAENRTAAHEAREQRLRDAAQSAEVRKEQAHATRMGTIQSKNDALIETRKSASAAAQTRSASLTAAKVAAVQEAAAQRAVQAEIKKNSMVAAAEQQAVMSAVKATEQKAVANSRMSVAETRAAEVTNLSQVKQSTAHATAANAIAISEAKKQAAIARSSVQIAADEQKAMASIARSQASYERSMMAIDTAATKASGSFIGSMQNIGRAGNNIQWTGRQLESNFTIPLGIAGAAAGYFALQSESSMTRVRKIYGDASMSLAQVTSETEALERASHALGATYGQTIPVVQDTMADWIATGATGAAAMRATELSLKTALLGEMDLAAATESLISIQGQYNLSTTEMAAAVDTLNMAEQNAGAKYGDYIEAMEKSAGTARSAGIDVAHLSAMVSSLVPAAGSAAQAGNSLKTIFSRLLSPTREAAQVMGMMGVNVEDASWKSMTGAERLEHMAQKYVELANNVDGAGEKSEETGKKISAQAVVVSKTLASTWQISRFETLMRDLADENGRYQTVLDAVSDGSVNAQQSQKELNAILDNTPMTLKQIGVYMQGYLINMIKPLLPVIVSLAATVATLVSNFAALPYPIQAVVIGGLALLAVFGPLAKYLGSFISLFGIVGGVAHMLGDAFGFTGAKVAGTSRDYAIADAAIGSNTNAFRINAASAAATASAHEAVAARIRNASGIIAASSAAPAAAGAKGAGAAGAAASSALPTAVIAGNAKKAGKAFDEMGAKASKAGATASGAMAKTGAKAGGTVGLLARLGPAIKAAFVNPWVAAGVIVVGVLVAFWDQIVVFFDRMVQRIASGWSYLPDAITGPLEAVVNIVKSAALRVYDWFSYLNPWAHHSPSLVEQVTSGMAEVQRQYGYMGNVGAPFMKAAKDLKAFKDAVSSLPASKAEAAEPRNAIKGAGGGKALAMYDKMARTLDALNAKQAALTTKIARQQAVVNAWASSLERANSTLDRQQSKLDSLTAAHEKLNNKLSEAQSKMSEYTNAPIKGLGAMEDAIFANEMAQKRLQLKIAEMGDTDGYKKAADQVAMLQGEIETLTGRRTELYSKGAGSDILGPIDKQIDNLRKQQKETDKAAGGALAKAKALEDELKKLQDRATVLDLKKSLKFDGLQRDIDKAANSAKELTFAEIIAGIKKQKQVISDLQPKVDKANDAMEKQERVVDAATAARDRIQKSYDSEQKKLEKLNNTYESTAKLIADIDDSMKNLSATVAKAADDKAQAKAAKAAAKEAKQTKAKQAAEKKARDAAAKAAKSGDAAAKLKKTKMPKAESLSPGAKNFMDAAGGGYDDPGGVSTIGREGGLGDQAAEIDKMTDEMNQNLIDKFAKLDMFGPIREKWAKFKGWMSKTFDAGFGEAGRIAGDAILGSLRWIGEQTWLQDLFTDVFGGDALKGTNLDGIGKSFENAMEAIRSGWDKLMDGDLGKQMSELWDAIKNLGKALLPIIQAIGVIIGAVAAVLVGALAGIWGALMGFLPPLIEYLGVIIGFIVGVISGLIKIIVGVITGVINIVSGALNVIMGVLQWIWGALTLNRDAMREGNERFLEGIKQIYEGVVNILTGLWEGVKDIFGSIFDLIIGTFKFLVTGVVGIVSGLVNGIINWFTWLWDVLVGNSIIPDTVNAIVEWFQKLWDDGVALIAGLVDGVIQWFKDMWTGSVDAVANLLTGARDKFVEIRDTLKEKAEAVRKAVVDKFLSLKNGAVNKVKDLLTAGAKKFVEIKDNLKGKAESVRKVVVDKWNSMKKGAGEKAEALRKAGSKKFDDIKTNLKGKADKVRSVVVSKWGDMKKQAGDKAESMRKGNNKKFDEIKKNLKDKAESIRSVVSKKFKAMRDNVIGWAKSMRDKIKGPIKSFANNLRSPINLAIKAVRGLINGLNKIPKHLPGLNWTIGKPDYVPKFAMGTENIPAMRVGSGKTVAKARAIVGEGPTNHKEYVVPTDPRHRKRAVGLHRKLGQDLGVPMYANGGILNKAGNIVKGAASKVKDTAGNVWGGMKNFGSAALKNLGKVGEIGKGLLSDGATWVKKHASNAMSWLVNPLTKKLKQKVSDVFPGERGMVPRKTGHWAVDKLNDWATQKDAFYKSLAEHITAESGGGDYAGGNGKGWKWQMQVLRSQFPGLNMNSGPRPGAVTASGNTSYHSRGLAVDVPPRKDVFNFIARNFPGTAELIHSPMGRRQLKNGNPYVYQGAVKAMHYNHVHWAYTGKGMRKGYSGAGSTGGGGNVRKRVQRYAEDKYGWGHGGQWNDLAWLINKESGWNMKAANPRSSARGLFQKMTSIHGPVEGTPEGQAAWGLKYIKGRYRTPSGAAAFHRRNNYYANGGVIGDPAQQAAMLANGGIVKSTIGGTRAVVGEGRNDEAVFQLPAGWQSTFNNFGTLSTDIVSMRDAANMILAASKGSPRTNNSESGTSITNVTYNQSSETNVHVTGDLSFPNVKNGDDVGDLIEALKAVAK